MHHFYFQKQAEIVCLTRRDVLLCWNISTSPQIVFYSTALWFLQGTFWMQGWVLLSDNNFSRCPWAYVAILITEVWNIFNAVLSIGWKGHILAAVISRRGLYFDFPWLPDSFHSSLHCKYWRMRSQQKCLEIFFFFFLIRLDWHRMSSRVCSGMNHDSASHGRDYIWKCCLNLQVDRIVEDSFICNCFKVNFFLFSNCDYCVLCYLMARTLL